jgi:hypothetical protein
MVSLHKTATEYTANQVTFNRGSVSDIVAVGIFMTTDPALIPTFAQFVTATLVDGTGGSPPPLAEAGKVDILAKIGPGGGGVSAGIYDFSAIATQTDYQRWTMVRTADEIIIRRPDTVTIIA